MAEAIDIDAVVREVLKRLRAFSMLSESSTAAAAPPAQPATQTIAPKQAAPADNATTLAFNDRLVTLAALDGKLSGIKKLSVGRKAIVTPAVTDELRKRGIAVVRHESSSPQNTRVRLLASSANLALKTAVRSDLSAATSGIEWLESHATNSLLGAVQELSKQVAQRKLPGMMLTEQPLSAAVVANRNQNIRAVVVGDSRSLDEALSQVGCNLVAVDPRRVGPAVLKIVAQRLADSQPTCPTELVGK